MHSYRSVTDGMAYAPEALPELDTLPTAGGRLKYNLNTSAGAQTWLSSDAAVKRHRQDEDEPQHARVFSLNASALFNDSKSESTADQQNNLISHECQQLSGLGDQVSQSTPVTALVTVSYSKRFETAMTHCMLWNKLLLIFSHPVACSRASNP